MINFFNAIFKNIAGFLASASRVVLIIIFLVCITIGFLFYTGNLTLRDIVSNGYLAQEEAEPEGDAAISEGNEGCKDAKHVAKSIANFYRSMVVGGDISSDVENICHHIGCLFSPEEISSKFYGSTAMSSMVSQMALNINSSSDKFKRDFRISRRIFVVKKQKYVEKIDNKKEFVDALHILAKNLRELDYESAINAINMIENSDLLNIDEAEDMKDIKSEVETVIKIQEVIGN